MVSQSDVEKLGKQIQTFKLDLASLEGQQSSILETLKNDFGIDNIEDARKELKELESENQELSGKMEQLFAKAQEILNG